MAVLHPERTYTLEEYFALEAQSEERIEFEDGVLIAMGGETGQHNDIVTNIILALAERTRTKGCRIRLDLTPCFVAEVLSPSDALSPCTANRDKGRKMDAYLRLPSLELYLLVDSQVRKVGVYRRTAQGWLYEMLQDGAIKIPCIGAKLGLGQIYAGLDVQTED